MASSLTAFSELPPGERGRKVMEAIQALSGEQDSAVWEELQSTVFNKLLEQGYADDIESILIDTRAACSVAALLLEKFYKPQASSPNDPTAACNFVGSAFEAIVGMLSGIYIYFEEEIVPTIQGGGAERATRVLKDILKFHEEVIALGNSVADFVEMNSSQYASLKVLVNSFFDLGEITVSKAKVTNSIIVLWSHLLHFVLLFYRDRVSILR